MAVIPVSWCLFKTHYYLTFMTTLLLLLVCDLFGVWVFPLTVLWVMANIWEPFSPSSRKAWCGVGILLVLFGASMLLPMWMHLLLLRDSQRVKKGWKIILDSAINWICTRMDELSVPLVNPVLGVNSTLVDCGLKEHLESCTEALREITNNFFLGFETEAVYLRKVGITDCPIEKEGQPNVPARDIERRYEQILNTTRLAVTLLALYVSCMYLGFFGLAIIFISVLAMQLEEDSPDDIVNIKNKGAPIKDGIYKISNYLLSVPVSYGIGVCFQGVLHVPYHVCRGSAIRLGKTKLKPYLINIREDLVTYGGLPQITPPQEGDKIYVNCETDLARTTYKVDVDYDMSTNHVAWLSVTMPGESGSPVLAWRDEKFYLIGLAGRYVTGSESQKIEYSLVTPREEDPERIKQILLHPGAGKTRKVIPKLVQERLPAGRILILGPTRVVCTELWNALKKTYKVGLNIRGSNMRNTHAPIQIAAHRSGLSMLCQGVREVRGVKTVILDEAHFDDPSTKMLRMMLRSPEYDCDLYELSATLDGKVNRESNYDINDVKISHSEIMQVLKDNLESGKRVMVFVQSMKDDLVKKIRGMIGVNPILLSRETFAEAMKSIQNEERKVIISTNIAECGINVPGLETVIDTCKRFTYVFEGNFVIGKTLPITLAEQTQRRGRIGRTQPGTYYYTDEPIKDQDVVTAADFDAKVLSTGRKWCTESNEWGIKLEDKVFMKWFDLDHSPLWLYVAYNTEGIKRSSYNIGNAVIDIRKEGMDYIGCKNKKCECRGTWKMYDERMHESLFGVEPKGGTTVFM